MFRVTKRKTGPLGVPASPDFPSRKNCNGHERNRSSKVLVAIPLRFPCDSLAKKKLGRKTGTGFSKHVLVAKIFIVACAESTRTKIQMRHEIAPRAPMSVTTSRFMIDLAAEMPLEKSGWIFAPQRCKE